MRNRENEMKNAKKIDLKWISVCVCVRVLAAQTQEQEGESNRQGSQTAETLHWGKRDKHIAQTGVASEKIGGNFI